jgi:hypothetical protein
MAANIFILSLIKNVHLNFFYKSLVIPKQFEEIFLNIVRTNIT